MDWSHGLESADDGLVRSSLQLASSHTRNSLPLRTALACLDTGRVKDWDKLKRRDASSRVVYYGLEISY